MKKRIFSIRRNQRGFTLIEILVAVAITAIIGSAITMAVTQLFSVSISDKNRMEAVKQVENALHYINRDAQMAKASLITTRTDAALKDYPLILTWINYDEASKYTVTYSVKGSAGIGYYVERYQEVNPSDNPSTVLSTTTNSVASNINIDTDENGIAFTRYSYNGSVLEITLESKVEGYQSAAESRTMQVKPRIN